MTDYIIALIVIIVAIIVIKKVTTCLLKTTIGIIALAIIAYVLFKAGILWNSRFGKVCRLTFIYLQFNVK